MVRWEVEDAPRTYARVAGVLYLVIIAAGLFAELGVRDRLMVDSNAGATAANIITHAPLYRFGIIADLSTFLLAVPLTVIFYLLLRPVNRTLALLTVLLNVTQDAIGAVNALNTYRPLQLLGGARYLSAFDQPQLNAMAMLSLRTHEVGFGIALLFFGVCCVVLGYLMYVSGFFPRFLGILLAIAGFCYVVNTLAEILSPALESMLLPWILLPAFIGELSVALWLAVKGIDAEKWRAQSAVGTSVVTAR
jgi:hypothetical protein